MNGRIVSDSVGVLLDIVCYPVPTAHQMHHQSFLVPLVPGSHSRGIAMIAVVLQVWDGLVKQMMDCRVSFIADP